MSFSLFPEGSVKKNLEFLILILLSLTSCAGISEEEPEPPEQMGKYIEWDDFSRVRILPFDEGSESMSYPRMEILDNGDYFLVYESVSKGAVFSILSSDQGVSWGNPQLIFDKKNGINSSVPEVVQLSDGSLLVAVNYRPSGPYSEDRRFGIAVRKSRDYGATWEDEQLLYEAGYHFEDGCWEPSLLQLPDGEIQLYFSNEAPYPLSDDQNISMLRSYDNGNSWTEEPEVVSYRRNSRDGMPVPLFLPDRNEILLVIEDKYYGEFKPSIVSEKVNQNWTRSYVDASDDRRDFNPLDDFFYSSIYAGAPYIDRLGSGELVLSLQTTFGRGSDWDKSTMMVFVGETESREFYWGTEPFEVPVEKRALWNSLVVTEDDEILALTSTDAYSANGNSEIWLVRGKLCLVEQSR